MDLHLTWKVPVSALADVSETNSRIKVTNHQMEKYAHQKKQGMLCIVPRKQCLPFGRQMYALRGCLHPYTSSLPLIWLLNCVEENFQVCKEISWWNPSYFEAQLHITLCQQQYIALCRHNRSDDQRFDVVVSVSVFQQVLLMCVPFNVLNIFLGKEQNKKKSLLYDSVSCLQKDLTNQLTVQPFRCGWNMVQFPWAFVLALYSTVYFCPLIFLPFHCLKVATLLKIYLMLLDASMDNGVLCRSVSKPSPQML